MSIESFHKDLIVLAADPTMQRTIKTLLDYRRESLGISNFSAEVMSHRNRDPGCRVASGEILNPVRNSYRKAMVIFDYHGCGERDRTASQLEIVLEQEFQSTGWGNDRIVFIAIDPELEAWAFGSSIEHLQLAIGWSQETPLKEWLELHGHLDTGTVKPLDPQTALDVALQLHGKRRSARLFVDLAHRASLVRCQDPAFQKFRATLRRWFPA